MSYFISVLMVLLIGMLVLMAGILISKDREQSLWSAFGESVAWGVSFFVSFSAQAAVVHEYLN